MTTPSTTDQALPERAVHELAAATATLVSEHDMIGAVSNLLAGCVRSVGARAAGILMAHPDDDRLEFLAATTHRAEDIELFQLQVDEGPGIDTISGGRSVTASGHHHIAARWPTLAEPFRAAGFAGVHAAPMTWQGRTLGAVNLFFADEAGPDAAGTAVVAQAFADIATATLLHAGQVSPTQVVAQTRAALSERAVIERAKGVIAYTEDVPMEVAFDRLAARARQQDLPMTSIAAAVVDDAVNNRSTPS